MRERVYSQIVLTGRKAIRDMTPKGRETNKTDLDQRRKFSGLVTKLHGNEGKTHLGTDIWVDSVMIKQALADSN